MAAWSPVRGVAIQVIRHGGLGGARSTQTSRIIPHAPPAVTPLGDRASFVNIQRNTQAIFYSTEGSLRLQTYVMTVEFAVPGAT